MFRNAEFVITILVVSYAVYGIIRADDELPFGSYSLLPGQDISDILPVLHDTLGFNIFWDSFEYSDIEDMGAYGMVAIKQGSLEDDSLYILSYYNYAKIQAEEYESKVRMYNCGGSFVPVEEPSLWLSEAESVDTLYGPNGWREPCTSWEGDNHFIRMPRTYYAVEGGGVIQYTLELRMKIDAVHTPSDSAVARLWLVCEEWCNAKDTLLIDSLRVNEFTGYDDQLIDITRTFTLPETILCCPYPHSPDDCQNDPSLYQEKTCDEEERNTCGWATAFMIETTGIRDVSIDYIKVYDLVGRRLVEESWYNDQIIANAQQYTGLGDDLWGWYMRDEPLFTNIPPIGYISSVVRDTAEIDWHFISAIYYSQLYGYWFEQGNEEVITPDIYPFLRRIDQDSVTFTGFGSDSDNHALSPYMQNRMMYYTEACTLAYKAASDHNAEFWIIPQCFKGRGEDAKWRYPTNAELSCQVFIALATGARGIIFWKYGISGSPPAGYIWGMHDDEYNRLNLWYAVKDLNPYIKAIDSTFLQLSRERTYTYKNGLYSAPGDAYISSISTWIHPDSVIINPDSGWFQVGEFTDTTDAKYIMLVNRACSQGPENPDPAPSVTATVKFDPTALGLGNYVYIIDIADSVDYVDYDSVLFYADTTYSATLGGTIPFTTVLGPGEGRLFKIVGTVLQ